MSIFFNNSLEQRNIIDQKLAVWHSNFRKGAFFYNSLLNKHLTRDSIVLDAGCGDLGLLDQFKHIPKQIIGADLDLIALDKNPYLHKKIVANLAELPLNSESMDLISCEFVLEHLHQPQKVFKEFWRILKPGGNLLVLTPNVLNPVIFLSKILPFSVHRFIRSKLLRKGQETFRTLYRANTRKSLLSVSSRAGFALVEFYRAGNPDYFAMIKPLVVPSILFERLLDNSFLNIFKMYLIASFQKFK